MSQPSKVSWPALFTRPYFTAHENYPHSVADMVGHWAEDLILRGVAILARSKAWTVDSEPDVYFRICRYWAAWRIWQLLPSQQEDLVKVLLRNPPSSTDPAASPDGPWPIMPSHANTVRMDPSMRFRYTRYTEILGKEKIVQSSCGCRRS